MKLLVTFGIIAITYLQLTTARHLPSEIVACKLSDASLNDCAAKHANDAIPLLLPGIKDFNIPPLDPFLVESVEVQAGPNLNMKFKNIKAVGLNKAHVESLSIDTKKQHIELKLSVPELVMSGDYEINGKILVLPIKGKGPGVLTYTDPVFTATMDYDLEKHSDGVLYGKMKNEKLTYTIKKASYKLDNLFNGDVTLGNEMNKFLNENWETVSNELNPVFGESMKNVVVSMMVHVFETVPYEEFLLV